MKAEVSYVGNRLLSMGYSKEKVIEMVPDIEKICMEQYISTGSDNLEEILSAIGCAK